ncbi:sugar ABC transporter ATP-binding protein [Benzoatithermus flavus]
MTSGEPILRMSGIAKSFPGVQALQGVDLVVGRGEIHALLGENGAGKSTLLKILSGAQAPDAGTIVFDGREVRLDSPHTAQDLGIVTIYQEFNLVPTLSVAENVFIGRLPVRRGGRVDWRLLHERTAALTRAVGLAVDPRRLVADLSVAEQQMVEIARALSMDARLVVMDEPTSALSEKEVQRLMALVRELKSRGIAVIFVTHRLEEVMQLCDRMTVLRDGRLAGTGRIAETTIDDIIRLMVGREIERLFAHREDAGTGPVALEIQGIARGRDPLDPHAVMLHDVSLTVRQGEIVGLAGLVGAGRTELARAIFGADPIERGRILVQGHEVQVRSPKDAIRAGIGLVPEDRKLQALFLSLAIRTNLAVAAMDRLAGAFGLIAKRKEEDLVESFRKKLGIRMTSPEQVVGHLSGGNQQKVVLARWLALQPRILIVDEPTRGIDVAAKAEVHALLYELAAAGIAILAISSELPEILTISDRIITMREGRITGELTRAEASEQRLMQLMALGRREAA